MSKTIIISLVLFVIALLINIVANILEKVMEKKKKEVIELQKANIEENVKNSSKEK